MKFSFLWSLPARVPSFLTFLLPEEFSKSDIFWPLTPSHGLGYHAAQLPLFISNVGCPLPLVNLLEQWPLAFSFCSTSRSVDMWSWIKGKVQIL
jgi:hypothetical protein